MRVGAQKPLLACETREDFQQSTRYFGSLACRSVWQKWGLKVGAQTIQTLFAVFNFTLLPLLGTRTSSFFYTSYIFCHSPPLCSGSVPFLRMDIIPRNFFSFYPSICSNVLFQFFFLLPKQLFFSLQLTYFYTFQAFFV